MLSMTHGCGDPGFRGKGKKFIGDISQNGGDEGDIDYFSDESNASEYDLSSSENEIEG